jgi:hypothetical protein
MKLETLDLEDRFFRLSRSRAGKLIWSVDLWPTMFDWSRVRWDPFHKGPILALPRTWTVLDAVDAMIEAEGRQASEGCRKPAARRSKQ